MRITITLILLLIVNSGFGQKKYDYSVSSIPEEFQSNSIAIVRFHETTLEINSISRATMTVKYAVTILKKAGVSHGVFHEYYDSFRKLGGVKATIYNAKGDIIEKVKSSDIRDYSATTSYSIYDDNRQRYYEPQIKDLPYTVEYEYDYSFNGIFQLPGWSPVIGYEIAVMDSWFKVSTPIDYKLRYQEKNLPQAVNLSTENRTITYLWSAENLLPIEMEPFSPSPDEYLPIVYLAPVEFEIGGFKGNMESWKNMGQWLAELSKGRDQLNDSTIDSIRKLVHGIETDRDKVKTVYSYVQNRTRYVSIQLGLGGWQPTNAMEVDLKGYGDCKGLSNYTLALLNAIGIRSHYVIVIAGKYPKDIREEFVSNQANHAFLCVPLKNDTIWLECTSQTSPFGYIGNFTHGRKVLLITEDGGKIVKTREYPRDENRQIATAIVRLEHGNTGSVKATTTYTGLQYDNISARINDSGKENERWIYNNLGLNNFTLNSFNFSGLDEIPSAVSELDFTIAGYCSQSGTRLFIPLNMFNRMKSVPPKVAKRMTNVELDYPWWDIDTIRYIIPQGYKVEAIPEPLSIVTQFGEYSSTTTVNGNMIIYVRDLKMNSGLFPSESYNDLRDFYTKISRADNTSVVLNHANE